MDFSFTVFSHPDAWVSLFTLTFLEIVLGVDNIIFISLIVGKLPYEKQRRTRNIGLLLALVMRLILLSFIGWIITMTTPLFTLPLHSFFELLGVEHVQDSIAVSGRDLILILGGFFLLAKSTTEIHGKVAEKEEAHQVKAQSAFSMVLLQIVLIDIVFSFDSILTAVGLTPHLVVMMAAVIVSILVMMLFAGRISDFINRYPTLQMLALSFLIMIGLTLILEGFAVHINKAFVYTAVLFSLFVEYLNIKLRKKIAG